MTQTPATSPSIDYLARDYDGLREALLNYARQAFPEWTPSSEGDFGVMLVELLAYMGDVLSYYADRAQNEAYLATATQRASVLNIAHMLGYSPATGTPATGQVILATEEGQPPVTVRAGTQVATNYIDAVDGPIVFETTIDVYVEGNGGSATVPVIEGTTIYDAATDGPITLGSSDGTPGQTFRLDYANVYRDSVEVSVAGTSWRVLGQILDAVGSEAAVALFSDGDGYLWLVFGDDVNGAIPPTGLDIQARFRVGYGSAGNLPAGAITTVASPDAGVTVQMLDGQIASYPDPTTGGSDAESTELIRINAPRSLRTLQRVVTLSDFADAALSIPGVAKSKAVAGFYSSVTVYILGPDGGSPTEDVLNTVSRELSRRALAGVSVTVSGPILVRINVGTDPYDTAHTFSYVDPLFPDRPTPISGTAATNRYGATANPVGVVVWPEYSRTVVKYRVEQEIKDWLSFTNQTIGARLSTSSLYARLMSVEGVQYVTIPALVRDTDSIQTLTDDIQLGAMEFPIANMVVVNATGGIEG